MEELSVGDLVLSKYRIESVLGAGGMGKVLRAYEASRRRTVAIKVLHPELVADADSARRFALEARATAALESEHAVRVFEAGRLPSGAPFIVMEYLEGQDLASLVEAHPSLPLERAADYLLQATDAIEEAHGKGVIHRDLKPQNLFLTNDGVVKVVDFGLAKTFRVPAAAGSVTSERGVDTATNTIVGSPHYMSPEQLRSSRDVDARTDVWALGATFYHLLMGEPPFLAPTLTILCARIWNEEVASISRRRDDVPVSIDALVARCLAKSPGDRFQTVSELRSALISALADQDPTRTVRDPRRIITSVPPPTRADTERVPSTLDPVRSSELTDEGEPAPVTEALETLRRAPRRPGDPGDGEGR